MIEEEKSTSRPIDIPWLAACAVVTAIAVFLRFYESRFITTKA